MKFRRFEDFFKGITGGFSIGFHGVVPEGTHGRFFKIGLG